MKKYLIIGLLFLIATVSVNAQSVSAGLYNNEIKIGEQTFIDLELRVSAAESNVMLPAVQDTISKFIEVVKVSNIDTTFDQDDITTKIFTQRILITSWDSGLHVIPPFKFIIGGDTIKTEPLLLTVNNVALQADQDIKDIKDIMEVPFSLTDWILANRTPIGLILLAILLVIVGIILFKRYRNRPQEEKEVFVPKEAADKVANQKLLELEAKKLWQNDHLKEYYSNLSFIIREYIENRFELRALELTTDEINALIQGSSEVEKTEKAKLYELLSLADMAKFAKQKPIAIENEEALKSAYIFIKKTAIKLESEAIENASTDGVETKTDSNHE